MDLITVLWNTKKIYFTLLHFAQEQILILRQWLFAFNSFELKKAEMLILSQNKQASKIQVRWV